MWTAADILQLTNGVPPLAIWDVAKWELLRFYYRDGHPKAVVELLTALGYWD